MLRRLSDILIVLMALPLVIPVFIIAAMLVRAKLGSPVIYKQERGGLNGKCFLIWKFRSMTDERDVNGHLLSDKLRLTPFGKTLRATSIDEIPCLWNVLRGDMSIVGPRPFIADYLDLYSQEQFRRHEVKPGITGWAQVNGRNSLTWEEKFALDVWYVDHRNLLLDLKILFLTVQKVFIGHGVNSDEFDTMPRFRGSERQ